MSVNLLFQPDAALANDGSSSLSGNYLSQRGRGQKQQQQQVPQSSNREAADTIAANGEFGKKSRVNEYYNAQDQPFQNAGTPNVRIRNQFNQSNKDNTERDNNRITQFGSREQQPPR